MTVDGNFPIVSAIYVLFYGCASANGGLNLTSAPPGRVVIEIDCAREQRQLDFGDADCCDRLVFVEGDLQVPTLMAVENKDRRGHPSATHVQEQLQSCANALTQIVDRAQHELHPDHFTNFKNAMYTMRVVAVAVTRTNLGGPRRGNPRNKVYRVRFPFVNQPTAVQISRPGIDLWAKLKL
jgi:hypothetical protein